MFCRICGEELLDDSLFCPSCGKQVKRIQKKATESELTASNTTTVRKTPQATENQTETTPPVIEETSKSIEKQPKQVICQPDFTQPAPVESAERKKKSKLPVVIIALVLVAAIITGVIFVPQLFKENGASDSTTENDGLETVWLLSEVYEYGELVTSIKYDNNGNCLQIIDDGEISEEYVYDDKGNCTKKTFPDEVSGGTHFFYTYDNDGKLIEEDYKEYYLKELDRAYITSYEYDNSGKLIKETRCSQITDYVEITTYEYNDNGALIKQETNDDGKISYTHYKYDNNGNIIEKLEYSDREGEWLTTNKYDDNGNLRESHYERQNAQSAEEDTSTYYQYDDVGNLIKVKLNACDHNIYTASYKYNNGQCTEYTYVSGDGEDEIRKVYEYYNEGTRKSVTTFENDIKEEYIEYDKNGCIVKSSSHRGDITATYISVKVSPKQAEKLRKFQKDYQFNRYLWY